MRAVLRRAGAPVQRVGEVLSWLGTEEPNMLGDRNVEWAWVVAKLPPGPGTCLDFGNGGSYLGLVAVEKGYRVTAVDLEPVHWWYRHPNLKFIQGDILDLDLPPESFDVIINCSSIEHVGLSGRYGILEDNPEADIQAMARMRCLLRPGGAMVLTIPVGKDAVFRPLHRVYGIKRLPRLLDGWQVEAEEHWVKDETNRWVLVEREVALGREPKASLYGLGLFVLARGN